ncbi:intersectin-2b isoform X1 [Lates japonicus]|uniref:Intersectin-2b isoform X1 n=1 Tax=Lates japonicus TaxID=270547 RepID=A0AAD3M7S3_LATJO|nr:intersectin-2b isoform X1 [Lates japonicus]
MIEISWPQSCPIPHAALHPLLLPARSTEPRLSALRPTTQPDFKDFKKIATDYRCKGIVSFLLKPMQRIATLHCTHQKIAVRKGQVQFAGLDLWLLVNRQTPCHHLEATQSSRQNLMVKVTLYCEVTMGAWGCSPPRTGQRHLLNPGGTSTVSFIKDPYQDALCITILKETSSPDGRYLLS